MNSYLEAFIRDAKAIAHQHSIEWQVPLDQEGIAERGRGWNLTVLVGALPPPMTWLNDFGTDRKTVELLNSSPPPAPVREYKKRALGQHWQDLIKAVAIDQLLVRRTTPPHVACNVVRPLRVLATCTSHDEPSMISVDDVKFAIETARQIQASGRLADSIFGVVRSILDANHFTHSARPVMSAASHGP